VTENTINMAEYINFLEQILKGRMSFIILIADRASYHSWKLVRKLIGCHRHQIRLHGLPGYSPKRHPDEHMWDEISLTFGVGRSLIPAHKPSAEGLSTSCW
jgi:hypothetical protein